MAHRLRDDLLRRLLLPMASILLVSAVLSYQLAVRFANSSYDLALLESTRSIARLAGAQGAGNFALPPAAQEMFQPGDGDRAYFQIFSSKRGVIAGTRDLPQPPGEDIGENSFYDGQFQGEKLRLVAMTMPAQFVDEEMLIVVAETRNRSDAMAREIVGAVVVPQLILIFFAVAIIFGGVSSGLKPLNALAESLDKRRRDELTPLSSAKVPGEAVPLINAFNGLLARLGEVLSAQQRFVADAAHQLRTPLAALKIQLAQALREPEAGRRQELLEHLKISVDRTARLSDQLLLLARAEPGGDPADKMPVDLRALALDVGGQWVPRAVQLGRDLGFAGGDDHVNAIGDRTQLGELIANLLDNALRYGGTQITLSVIAGDGGGGPELVVEDNGPGIPTTEKARVFERFHRVPGTAGEGSGLGLAIVRQIAHGHGAEVEAEDPEAGGLRIRIRFPVIASGRDESMPPP